LHLAARSAKRFSCANLRDCAAGRGNIGDAQFPARTGATAPAKGLFLVSVEY